MKMFSRLLLASVATLSMLATAAPAAAGTQAGCNSSSAGVASRIDLGLVNVSGPAVRQYARLGLADGGEVARPKCCNDGAYVCPDNGEQWDYSICVAGQQTAARNACNRACNANCTQVLPPPCTD